MAVPALVRRGPFSFDETNFVSNRTYSLTKAQFDTTNGEIIEVFLNGIKITGSGLNASGDDFTATYTSNVGTSIVINSGVLNGGSTVAHASGDTVRIQRLSTRSAAQVDFAPGSVIREQDLDNSTSQTLHVAQEAIDIALNSVTEDADGKFNANSKVIKSVADGSADNDAVNKKQLTATEVTTNDYKLEAKDWAQKNNGQVKAYSGGSPTGSDLDFSAKAYASVTGSDAPTDGSAKEWAQLATTPSATATDASAKEWAVGTSSHKNEGSAKQWALGGGSFVEGTEVTSGNYSAKKYASNASDSADAASASEIAARNSANAVTNIFDDFGDRYLGTMSSSDTATTASITGAKWAKGGSQITNVTQAS